MRIKSNKDKKKNIPMVIGFVICPIPVPVHFLYKVNFKIHVCYGGYTRFEQIAYESLLKWNLNSLIDYTTCFDHLMLKIL